MGTVYHYGVTVNSDRPTTGVFSLINLEHIYDDLNSGIDSHYEAAKEEARGRAKYWGEEFNEDQFNDWYEGSEDLIGFMEDPENPGYYIPDPNAEYSAIAGESYLQVIRSQWGIRCALCSPCFPGQGDADTPGEFLCYSVPPEVVGDYGDQSLKERIFCFE